MYIGQVWDVFAAKWDDPLSLSAVSSLVHKRDRWEKLVGTLNSSLPGRMPLRESSLDFPPISNAIEHCIREVGLE
ncbi:hypothetical protein E2C01_017994 [Portunus trituberculatus]|uniref:Uncharacterized protein n=1 Tax=Portunus trituberculatus TaxID=210409 RepID=A0A5B7DTX5_PORTR|nr:hypothetical protein [Portunus trituberculatus]